MNKKLIGIIGVTVVLGAVLDLAGCSTSGASAQGGRYSPSAIVPTLNGDSVTIPSDVINTKKNVEFDVKFDQGTATYMAYAWNGAIQVRASVCVPCRGRSFTLSGNDLICNTCGTVFSAESGKGISGVTACQNYPKASVPFTTGADGSLLMKKADLLTAFTNTLAPGLP